MKCPYCTNEMEEDGRWWSCHLCNFDLTFNDTVGVHYKYEYDLSYNKCALNLYPESNKALLWVFDSRTEKITQIHLTSCPTNITPTNVGSKIKTILTFL